MSKQGITGPEFVFGKFRREFRKTPANMPPTLVAGSVREQGQAMGLIMEADDGTFYYLNEFSQREHEGKVSFGQVRAALAKEDAHKPQWVRPA